ncbi:hypothetical protein JCM30760_21340 [Thiomicrorhabdus hydrogeniphila]
MAKQLKILNVYKSLSHHAMKDIINNLALTKISKSSIHGNGLFASEFIPKGFILGELDGQLINWDLHKNYELTFEWNAITNSEILVRPYRTDYSFINHSRKPNLTLKYNPLRVISNKDILKGDELTLDYRLEPLPNEYIENIGKDYL